MPNVRLRGASLPRQPHWMMIAAHPQSQVVMWVFSRESRAVSGEAVDGVRAPLAFRALQHRMLMGRLRLYVCAGAFHMPLLLRACIGWLLVCLGPAIWLAQLPPPG